MLVRNESSSSRFANTGKYGLWWCISHAGCRTYVSSLYVLWTLNFHCSLALSVGRRAAACGWLARGGFNVTASRRKGFVYTKQNTFRMCQHWVAAYYIHVCEDIHHSHSDITICNSMKMDYQHTYDTWPAMLNVIIVYNWSDEYEIDDIFLIEDWSTI